MGYRNMNGAISGLRVATAALFVAVCPILGGLAAEPTPASSQFGSVDGPSRTEPAAIGSYAKGCLAGASQLAEDGPRWAAMRLSRGRRWGHPELVAFLKRLSAAAPNVGLPGLMIGDMGQARGGPMKSGHRSHQIGLDVDIWLRPMVSRPDRKAREALSSLDLVAGRSDIDEENWRNSAVAAIPLAAKDPAVARIFVNPAIKRRLCERAPAHDRAWLSKVRAWWGHDSHFHVRLSCPSGSTGCKDQQPVPDGDGCGAELDWWFTDEPYAPADDPKPRKPLTLDDLPEYCRAVLEAQ